MPPKRNFTAIGVDGCKGAWFYVQISPAGAFSSGVVEDLGCLLAGNQRRRILVDIPIGLPDATGGRCCEHLARAKDVLGGSGRTRSVFNTPSRAVVESEHKDLKSANAGVPVGQRISAQSFQVAKKSRAVDELLVANVQARQAIGEVHPEVCFWAFNGHKPMAFSKKTHNGYWERVRLLRSVSAEAFAATESLVIDGKDATMVSPDDVLDAMVAALTATAPCSGLRSLPANPPVDLRRLPMRMLYTSRDQVRVGE